MTNPKEQEIRERFLNEFIKPEMLNKPYVIADWWLKEIDTLLHSDREAVREEAKEVFKNYWYHAGQWHNAECYFLVSDEGVCNCEHGKIRQEINSLLSPNK